MRPSLLLAIVVVAFVSGVQPAQAGGALNIALEAAQSSCVALPGDVYERVISLLSARGHTVSIVDGEEIDTAAEIDLYDVVVFGAGAFVCDWDWLLFDSQLEAYVQNGGGLVVTGWGAHYMASNPRNEVYPGLEAVLPVLKGTNFATGETISVLSGHEITDGLSDFQNPQYDNYGAGVRPGATVLIRHAGVDAGAALEVGFGRAVYLGPIYLANWSNYNNKPLLDGTTPDAQELFLRAVEWAGQGAPSPKPVPSQSPWAAFMLAAALALLVSWRVRRTAKPS